MEKGYIGRIADLAYWGTFLLVVGMGYYSEYFGNTGTNKPTKIEIRNFSNRLCLERSLFDLADKDNNGEVDRNEANDLYRAVGSEVSFKSQPSVLNLFENMSDHQIRALLPKK